MDEVMVEEFTELSISQFREIKQPLSVSFKNVYDPKNETSYVSGWVGFAFGAFIILFIFLFGMTILRSVANEKTNRVVEVVLSATTPQSLLAGKIIGVGLAALMQFLIWVVIVGVGLLIFRQTLFPDLLDPEMVVEQLAQKSTDQFQLGAAAFNSFVDLIYAQINFTVMLLYFVFFFIGGYLFYGSFFTAIGASMGSESDGQQYVIPISLLLLAALFSGYLAIYFPTSSWTSFFSFFPFTSPVVMMVKLGNGFPEGTVWQLFFSIFILYTTAVLVLFFAARIYKNGILQFGHRLKWRHLIRWITHK
jgi:ABC-2 type transport system permease protein